MRLRILYPMEAMHVTHLRELNLRSPSDIEAFRSFLAHFDLWLDEIDYGVVLEEKGDIIGSCCKLKNIVKCFAIDESHQGEGAASTLLSAITYRLFDEGYLNSFVFTKPGNAYVFAGLGYQKVAQTTAVILMEKGSSILDHINAMRKKYDIYGENNGAIVINANPFTLGHQYLIEYASTRCETLLVFVVEEDASSFPFQARFALIKQGTAHLANVIVIPSGPYIISKATFPNYFLRDKDNGFVQYALLDAVIFGEWYGRILHIKTRFAGEEPFDAMTRQYNATMKQVLPPLGVHVDIIERKQAQLASESDTFAEYISASKVRALLKEDKLEEVKRYVPQTTYDYLVNAHDIIAALKKHNKAH